MNWRKWNNTLHRDLGYLCFGLTIIYVVSGIAVNHIADWNPSYRITTEHTRIDIPKPPPAHDILVASILEQLGEQGMIKNSYQSAPDILQIFIENNTITANLKTGEVIQKKSQPRSLLYLANFLHLNHPKKMWTWFADIYALALGLLAVTGLFILKGKKGITGRGAWLVSAGLIIPLVFLWLYT